MIDRVRLGAVVLSGASLVVACGGTGADSAPVVTDVPATTVPTAVPAVTDVAGCDQRCRFPVFERSSEPLATADDGNCEVALAEEYGGDCTNFHWLGLLGDPSVLYRDGRYTMWFTAGERIAGSEDEPSWQAVIASSTSTDGVHWSDSKDLGRDVIPVLEGGTEGLDTEGIETIYVLPEPDGGLVAYFTGDLGAAPSSLHVIGRATSADGERWEKSAEPVMTAELPWEQPFDAGGFEVGGVLEPSVLYEDGRWRMWYVGFGHDPEDPDDVSYSRIGYAESTDGVTWAKRPEPVLVGGGDGFESLGVSHPNVVADPRGGYHLFYVGIGADEELRMGHAYSTDGIVWERNPANPIIVGEPGGFDAGLVGGPSAVFVDGELQLFYMGTPKPDFSEPVRFLRTVGTPG